MVIMLLKLLWSRYLESEGRRIPGILSELSDRKADCDEKKSLYEIASDRSQDIDPGLEGTIRIRNETHLVKSQLP